MVKYYLLNTMKRMKAIFFITFIWLLIPSLAGGETKTFSQTLSQSVHGIKPADIMFPVAKARAEIEVVRQAAVYLESMNIIKEPRLNNGVFKAFAAGLLKGQITFQIRAGGPENTMIEVTAKVGLDTGAMDKAIKRLLKDSNLINIVPH